MKTLVIGWGTATLFAVLLKLFTYEFFYPDDPTSGIALRFSPALASQQTLVETPSGSDLILVQDENSFVGEAVYRGLVNWGWIVLLIGWSVVLGIAYRSNRSQPKKMVDSFK